MVNNVKKEIELPNIIPIFPLEGVVMFPDTYLPLNVFEPRYLKMIDKAISTEHRLVGIIQPIKTKEFNKKDNFYQIGCAGKIVKFEETDDNKYLITLKGLIRFNLISEEITNHKFREANVCWKNFNKDLDINVNALDFSSLKMTLKKYLKSRNIKANMEAIDTFNDYNFVDQIIMICPLANDDKQLLLETSSISKRCKLLHSILDSYVNELSISNMSKH